MASIMCKGDGNVMLMCNSSKYENKLYSMCYSQWPCDLTLIECEKYFIYAHKKLF